jgi:pyruvate kinase
VGILQDLAGPKLRIGILEEDRALVSVGSEVTLTTESVQGNASLLPVPDEHLAEEIQVGGPILIGDGAVELEALEIDPPEIRCRVVVGGEVSSGKGVNVPGGLSARPILDDKDRRDLEVGAELGVDFVGVSYVRSADDLTRVRKLLRTLGRPTPLVAKIETALALERLDEILALTDAVMVARGDLSLEIPFERVPIEQKRIVRASMLAGRPVITATQMLHSMMHAPRPTRAEVNDVANAVLDGTDAVMLSEETAVGDDPVRACRTMGRIVEETLEASPEFPEPPLEGISPTLRELLVFARAAVRTARDVGACAILTWSRGGVAARLLSLVARRSRGAPPLAAPTGGSDPGPDAVRGDIPQAHPPLRGATHPLSEWPALAGAPGVGDRTRRLCAHAPGWTQRRGGATRPLDATRSGRGHGRVGGRSRGVSPVIDTGFGPC